MRFCILTLLSLVLLFQNVSAFTVGYLLPSYICGPPTDGLPKSLGSYLPYVMRHTNPGNIPDVRIDDATDDGTILNTQMLLANWHNRDNILACNNTIFITSALTNQPSITNQIVPGQLHTLTLYINGQFNVNTQVASGCDFYTNASQVTADDIANIALDGAVIYAQNASGIRVGNFTAFGPAGAATMEPWAACGPLNTGIVHTGLISCTGSYTNIQWQAPGNLVVGSTLTFKGAAVTDVGFGKHETNFPITLPNNLKLPVAKPTISLVLELGQQLGVFFVDSAKNAVANNQIVPNTFTVSATIAGKTYTTTTTKSPAILALAAQPAPNSQGTVTVTASNSKNANSIPTASTPFTYTITQGGTNAQANLVNSILSLCPPQQVSAYAAFGMDSDPDNQCAYQALLVSDLASNSTAISSGGDTIVTSAAQHSSSSVLSLITLLFVVVAAFFQH